MKHTKDELQVEIRKEFTSEKVDRFVKERGDADDDPLPNAMYSTDAKIQEALTQFDIRCTFPEPIAVGTCSVPLRLCLNWAKYRGNSKESLSIECILKLRELY